MLSESDVPRIWSGIESSFCFWQANKSENQIQIRNYIQWIFQHFPAKSLLSFFISSGNADLFSILPSPNSLRQASTCLSCNRTQPNQRSLKSFLAGYNTPVSQYWLQFFLASILAAKKANLSTCQYRISLPIANITLHSLLLVITWQHPWVALLGTAIFLMNIFDEWKIIFVFEWIFFEWIIFIEYVRLVFEWILYWMNISDLFWIESFFGGISWTMEWFQWIAMLYYNNVHIKCHSRLNFKL